MNVRYLDNLHRAFSLQASAQAESPALVMGMQGEITFAILINDANISRYLMSVGVGRGDVVGIFIPALLAMRRCWPALRSAHPMSIWMTKTAGSFAHNSQTSQPRLLVADGPVSEKVEQACAVDGSHSLCSRNFPLAPLRHRRFHYVSMG
jgi:non-ribosomal peptide synthetase component F